jgi:hypothetical protein
MQEVTVLAEIFCDMYSEMYCAIYCEIYCEMYCCEMYCCEMYCCEMYCCEMYCEMMYCSVKCSPGSDLLGAELVGACDCLKSNCGIKSLLTTVHTAAWIILILDLWLVCQNLAYVLQIDPARIKVATVVSDKGIQRRMLQQQGAPSSAVLVDVLIYEALAYSNSNPGATDFLAAGLGTNSSLTAADALQLRTDVRCAAAACLHEALSILYPLQGT